MKGEITWIQDDIPLDNEQLFNSWQHHSVKNYFITLFHSVLVRGHAGESIAKQTLHVIKEKFGSKCFSASTLHNRWAQCATNKLCAVTTIYDACRSIFLDFSSYLCIPVAWEPL